MNPLPRPIRLGSIVLIIAIASLTGGCDQQSSSSPQAQAQTTRPQEPSAKPAVDPPAATTPPKENTPMKTAAAPEGSVTLRRVDAQPSRRPPKSEWSFDLTLKNDAAEPRWFLLADPFEHPLSEPREAPGLAVFEAKSAGGAAVRMVRFSSTNDIVAFHLPSGSTLNIDNLALRCWSEQCPATLNVWASATLNVSGKPVLDGWLKGQPLSAPPGEDRVDMKGAKKTFKHLNKDFNAEAIDYAAAAKWSLKHDTASPWGAGISPEANETMRKAAEGAEPK